MDGWCVCVRLRNLRHHPVQYLFLPVLSFFLLAVLLHHLSLTLPDYRPPHPVIMFSILTVLSSLCILYCDTLFYPISQLAILNGTCRAPSSHNTSLVSYEFDLPSLVEMLSTSVYSTLASVLHRDCNVSTVVCLPLLQRRQFDKSLIFH